MTLNDAERPFFSAPPSQQLHYPLLSIPPPSFPPSNRECYGACRTPHCIAVFASLFAGLAGFGGLACRLSSSRLCATVLHALVQAHNKRATVLYLMHRYEESIEACQLVLQLNPHHFGAASGMGMCHLGREDHVAALAAFETALAINPGLDPIQTYAAALRAKLADDATGPR